MSVPRLVVRLGFLPLLLGAPELPAQQSTPPRQRQVSLVRSLDPRTSEGFGSIAGAHFIAPNRIVAVDNQARTLFSFDTAGTLLWRSGQRGQGPGDFLQPQLVRDLAAKDIVVFDRDQGRVSVLGTDGRFRTNVPMPGSTGKEGVAVSPRMVLRSAAGDYVLLRGIMFDPSGDGLQRATLQLDLISASGAPGKVLDSIKGPAILASPYQGRRIFTEAPFFASTFLGGWQSRLVIADGATGVVSMRDLRSGTREVLTLALPPTRPITKAEYATWVRSTTEGINNEAARTATVQFLESLYAPWPLPRLSAMAVGFDGTVWLRLTPNGIGQPAAQWRGYSLRSRAESLVSLPDGCTINDAMGNMLLATCLDSDGVPALQLWRVRP